MMRTAMILACTMTCLAAAPAAAQSRAVHTRDWGSVRIATGVSGAAIDVDGTPAGRADAAGDFFHGGLAPGRHTLGVTADGYVPFHEAVTVTAGNELQLTATLSRPPPGPSLMPWGVALLAAGAAGAVMGLYSGMTLASINHDATFQDYRQRIPSAISDVCTEADAGEGFGLDPGALRHVRSECGTAGVLNVLQWVFYGVAAAGLGVGSYLLLFHGHDAQERLDARAEHHPMRLLAVAPAVGPHGASVAATLRF